MPWKESCLVHERMLFVARLERGERMTDLCREFGISRKTGYKIHARYKEQSVIGLYDVKRAPERIPHRTSAAVADRIVALRNEHPTWGPRKLRAWLLEQEGARWPAASTISLLLRSRGLVQPRRRRRNVEPSATSLSVPTQPNDLWCIDFKGQFRLGNGHYCYPLTITDAHTRFLLVCEGMERIDGERVWAELERAFRRFGLPHAIRSDNGSPFASRGVCGISKLSARWIGLGVRHERIEPGKPQQNGRHERMHRTLKAETTRPAAKSMLAQQERFDGFCAIYNEQRPHEALEQTPPGRHYRPSARPYVHARPTYPLHDDVRVVGAAGHLRFPGGRRGPQIFISSALAGLPVGLRELEGDRWLVSYADIDLGVCDLSRKVLLPVEESRPLAP
jgi:transposase InsO family protein